MEATGGGPPCEELSQSERMVIETIHPDNILGHSNVLESIVTFEEQVISEPVVPVVVVTDDPVPVIISDITQDQSREKLGTPKVPKKKRKANRSEIEALMLQKLQVKRDLAEAKKVYYLKSFEAMNKQSEALQNIAKSLEKISGKLNDFGMLSSAED
ncbi:hypothetical protein EVAR_85167_1 [Eumeta japonica]|uniref:Uncharacterized protein n=1 Tax=Eumeta variegata TaxID=151549 RepID=A0A4C1ZY15_EUMVA|nr:hypothetical protein EVAR_85167_1 [Eumeta japonica]